MSGEVGEENNLANFQELTNLVLAGDQTDADPDPSKKQRTSEKPFLNLSSTNCISGRKKTKAS